MDTNSAREVICLDSVHKSYRLGETSVHALRGLSLSIMEGEFTAVVGTSGSGKSTLLNLIGGIDSADSGTVKIDEQAWSTLTDKQRSRLRNRLLGFVFQSFNLMPMLNVFENVEIPLLLQNEISAVERRRRVEGLLNNRPRKRYGGLTPCEVLFMKTGVALKY